MYLHRIYENHATPTAPGMLMHREWKLDTFFHDLSTAISDEIKLALWVQDYETPGKLAKWMETIMNSPVNDSVRIPLVLDFTDNEKSPHTITYRLDHHRLAGAGHVQ